MRTAGPQPGALHSRTHLGGKPRLCGGRERLDAPAPGPAAARTIPGRRVSRFHTQTSSMGGRAVALPPPPPAAGATPWRAQGARMWVIGDATQM